MSALRPALRKALRSALRPMTGYPTDEGYAWSFLDSIPSGWEFKRASAIQMGVSEAGLLVPTSAIDEPAFRFGEGVLLEPARTNVMKYSTLAGGGATPTGWGNLFSTGTRTPAASLLGSDATAYLFSCTAQRSVLERAEWMTGNAFYAFSVYVEAVTGTLSIYDVVFPTGLPAGCSVLMYVINGVAVPGSTTVVPGWISIITGGTFTGGAATLRFGLGAQGNITGSVQLSRPQMEGNASPHAGYATSFMPAASATVTRAGTSLTTNHVLPANNFSGHLRVRPRFHYGANKSGYYALMVCYQANDNYLRIVVDPATDQIYLVTKRAGAYAQTGTSAGELNYAAGDLLSIRFRIDSTGMYLWTNNRFDSDVSANAKLDYVVPPTLLHFGSDTTSSPNTVIPIVVESLDLWPTVKSDAFLEART